MRTEDEQVERGTAGIPQHEGDAGEDEHCERLAVGVDPDVKDRNLKRLRRIEGQVRGLHRMVDEERYCADVLTQISSVHQALRSVGRELVRNHLKHCGATAIRSGGEDAEQMYDEVVDMMFKHIR
ncbi:MAG: metal-sensitive transcriptional regulator [Gemmatimonadota bacterium]